MKPAVPDALPSASMDMRRCPLCGQSNQCAMELEKATGQAQPPCWCVSAQFPPALLAQLPPTARSCICPSCAQAHAQTHAHPTHDGR